MIDTPLGPLSSSLTNFGEREEIESVELMISPTPNYTFLNLKDEEQGCT